MRIRVITIMLFGGMASLLTSGCSNGKAEAESSAERLPWSRVEEVEVTSDTEAQQPSGQIRPKTSNGVIAAGASQSEVVIAWGLPDYIYDSAENPDRKIWQYSHALVVFQGTKVEKVLPR